MTRTLPRAAAAVACALAFAACSERAAPEPATLVFKHARILGPADPIPRLLAAFEARHPGVRVKAESLPWNADEQHQFFVINLEGGSPGFDVLMLDVIWVPEFARAGWLRDLTPHLGPDELAPHFPSAVEAARYRDRVWALPWLMNVGLLYYRRDLLDRHGFRPPATYEELVNQVETIRRGEGRPRLHGLLWQGKQYEGLVVNVLEALWANGTRLLGDDGTVFPEPARAAAALDFLRRLITSGISPRWVTAADEELTRRSFGNGEAIFLRNWPYAKELFEQPDSPVRGRVGIAPLPRHAGGDRGWGSTGGAHLAVHSGSRHPDLAVALARFLAGHEAQKAMGIGAALNPTWMALYEDPDLLAIRPALPAIRTLMLAGRPRPVTPSYLTLSTTLQPEFSGVLLGITTPERVVAQSRRRLQYLLHGVDR